MESRFYLVKKKGEGWVKMEKVLEKMNSERLKSHNKKEIVVGKKLRKK